MDVLSSVLATHQVKGAILSDGRYRGRFGVRIDQPGTAGFHLVVAGSCWLLVEGLAPRLLLQGDVAVIPSGAPHVLADDPTTKPLPLAAVRSKMARDPGARSVEDPTAHLVCGAFAFASGTPPALLSVLPRLVHLRGPEVQQDDLLRATLRLLLSELKDGEAGGAVIVDRLIDVLLVGVLRRWLAGQPSGHGGWLAALADERIGRALSAMHNRPERPWTVETLAHEAGMSRAAFAKRFGALVQRTPLSWLQSVRLDVASQRLQSSNDSVARIAADVGYQSEFAFSRAFKKATGQAPSHHRAAHRTPAATPTATPMTTPQRFRTERTRRSARSSSSA